MQVLLMTEAAKRARMSLRTWQRVIERGEGPTLVNLSERMTGVLEVDFEAWLVARRVEPTAVVKTADAPSLPTFTPKPSRKRRDRALEARHA
jgi:hypothetical protein